MLQQFADELKEAREKSGLTLKQIAAKTRIDIKFLEAIEIGDFMIMPELYIRAFIRQYAVMIGLDEHQTLRKYELAKDGKTFNEPIYSPIEKNKSNENKIKKPVSIINNQFEQSGENNKVPSKQIVINKNILFAVIGVIAVIFIVWFLFIKDNQTIIVTERPYEEIVQETRQRYIEEEPETTPMFSSDSLYLIISASDTTWINVESDNSLKDDFLLYPNSKKEIKAKGKFILIIGNSGGITLTLNNQHLEFNGRRNTVSRIEIDKNGLRYLDSQTQVNR